MNIAFIGFTLDVLGKVMVVYMAMKVHYRMWQEHKIDKVVFEEMKKERLLGFLGLALIVLGYLLQVPSKIY